jgi:hypothetical protein
MRKVRERRGGGIAPEDAATTKEQLEPPKVRRQNCPQNLWRDGSPADTLVSHAWPPELLRE